MKFAFISIIFVLQLIGFELVFGQNKMFGIGGVVGVNFTQLPFEEISINEQTNHHNGLNTGIFCNADINKHFNLKIEILYSKNGAYIIPKTFPYVEYSKIKLNHIEVPFHFDFYINSFKSTNFIPDWALEIGGAYTNLFHYYLEDINGIDVTEQIVYNNKSSFLFQIGTTIYFAKHFGVNLRYSLALLPLNEMSGITFTFRLIYRIYN